MSRHVELVSASLRNDNRNLKNITLKQIQCDALITT